jgi:hypothetical protein
MLLNAPDSLEVELPTGVTTKSQLRGSADVVLDFETGFARFERRIEKLGATIFPSGGLWVGWPKKSLGLETDMSDHVVRQLAISFGLVDNKVCAIDDTWTALRVVWRVENR